MAALAALISRLGAERGLLLLPDVDAAGSPPTTAGGGTIDAGATGGGDVDVDVDAGKGAALLPLIWCDDCCCASSWYHLLDVLIPLLLMRLLLLLALAAVAAAADCDDADHVDASRGDPHLQNCWAGCSKGWCRLLVDARTAVRSMVVCI